MTPGPIPSCGCEQEPHTCSEDDDSPEAEEPAPRKKRKKPASPSAMTLKECAKRGWIAGVVERFVRFPPPGHKVDLFGVIDIVAIVTEIAEVAYMIGEEPPRRAVATIGIQATTNTGGHHAKHRTKILAEPRARAWVEAGNRLELWTWAKQGAAGKRKLWTLRVEVFTPESWSATPAG